METYVIRIYRRGETPDDVVGTAESIEPGGPQAFENLRDLMQILANDGDVATHAFIGDAHGLIDLGTLGGTDSHGWLSESRSTC